jgi:hypothetical protein
MTSRKYQLFGKGRRFLYSHDECRSAMVVCHFDPAFCTIALWSFRFRSCIFHPCSFVVHFPVLYFPPLLFCPSFSGLTFSTPALLSFIFRSYIFHPCSFVLHFPVLHFPPPHLWTVRHFPVLHFQSTRQGHKICPRGSLRPRPDFRGKAKQIIKSKQKYTSNAFKVNVKVEKHCHY